MHQSWGEKLFNILNVLFMLFVIFICLYPFIYVTAISLNDAIDASRGGIYFWPREFSLASYQTLFRDDRVVNAYFITIYRVVVGTVLGVLLTAMFSYALSKQRFVLRRFLTWWVIIPLYFSGGLIPYYLTLRAVGLVNNLGTYVIPLLYSSFNIILLVSFFRRIPKDLEESAKLDGAGDGTIFWRIYVPLAKPALATVALFIGVGHWNDWFMAEAFVTNVNIWPLQNVLLAIIRAHDAETLARLAQQYQGIQMVTAESIKMAMIIVATVPVVMIYPFLQRYFIHGITLGSLKE